MSDVQELNINNSTYDIKAKSVVDTNSGKVKFWTGTKEEYDAITTKDPATLYNITDDSDVTFQLLELIYPVGSIYIGTMSVCPLQTLGLGTWQLKAQDMVLQGAGTKGVVKTELPQNVKLPNITGNIGMVMYKRDAAQTFNGSFSITSRNDDGGYSAGSNMGEVGINFNASRSSSVYSGDGTDTEIQQSAYLVNIWERTS